jgi:hypothetical protein
MASKGTSTKNPNGVAAGNPAATDSAATAADVRTPWGRFVANSTDREVRDPFEPEPPLTPQQIATRAAANQMRSTAEPAADAPALTPRELFEMLMGPAAQPTRSSPQRTTAPEIAAAPAAADVADVPPEAELILSALEAGRGAAAAQYQDRRGHVRRPYRARAALRLFSDTSTAAPWVLYIRDIHSRGLGFITPHRLPLGYGGMLEMPHPTDKGQILCIPSTLLRCREAAPGWFEGSLYFNREQPAFDKI